MKFRYIALTIGIILIAMLVYGLSFLERCAEIDGCRACWKMTPITVTSELCPDTNQPCIAEPYLQQHNALADMLMCACEKAEADGYANTELNHQIETTIRTMTNYTITAQDLCEQPGLLLAKRRYE